MKKLLLLLLVIPMLFNSCNAEDGVDGIDGRNGSNGTDGTDGINGTDGQDGQDGYNLPDRVFQGRLDFNTENDFETLFDFPSDVKIDYDDIILVYLATELIPGGGGEPPAPPTFVWEALPKTMYLEKGELTYGFKHSFGSVDSSLDGLHIFLDGSVDLNELPTELTNEIYFRVAVISAELISSANMDDLEAMISSIPNNEIIVLN